MDKPAPAVTDYDSDSLRLRIVLPSADLARYVSSYYRTEVAEGAVVEDRLPPEAANLRTGEAKIYEASIGEASLRPVPEAIISGQTDRGTCLRIGSGRFWGVGLTAAGWHRFIGLPAEDFANSFTDIHQHPSLDALAAMLSNLRRNPDDTAAAVATIEGTLRALPKGPAKTEATIVKVQRMIVADSAGSVPEMAEAAGMKLRTFERFTKRHFGFPPRILMRRRRFLRSLAQFMLDPSMRWVETLDPHYCDQAHFIRDFRALMGMTPSEYARLPHPIAGAAVAVRSKAAGVAMQALYRPHPSRDA